MDNYNFKQLCNAFRQTTCVVSVQRKENGYGEIRIVEGNEAYTNSFKGSFYSKISYIKKNKNWNNKTHFIVKVLKT